MQSYRFASSVAAIAAVAGGLVIGAGSAAADDLPAIKVSATNAVPACATPGRLQAYLKSRNPALDARFETIAVDYMRHGEALGVRWDYAFFQMIMETGQLSFKNGSRSGDVKPSQNNFAGLGATGGVPGESFPDVATGARAHLEHVLLYSGEKLASPVAERTRKVQEWGVLTDWQKGIKHPITYADLASKWAPKSKAYTDSLEQIAAKFFDDQCKKADPHPEFAAAARGQSWQPVMQTAAVAAPAVTPNAPATPAAQPALPPATAFDQPAEKAAEKVSGSDLARKAVSDGNNVRSGLGSGLAQQVKILNAPSAEEAAPAPD